MLLMRRNLLRKVPVRERLITPQRENVFFLHHLSSNGNMNNLERETDYRFSYELAGVEDLASVYPTLTQSLKPMPPLVS